MFPASTFVVLTEGIETALAVRTARPDLPVWAAIAAGHLAECQLPADLREILVAADHDANGAGPQGRRTARRASRRRRPARLDRTAAQGRHRFRGSACNRRRVGGSDDPLGRNRVSARLARSRAPSIIDTPAQCSIEDTKKLYPLPRLENLSLEYRRASEGSVRLYKHAGKDKRGQDRWEMVATPFGPVARLRYMDHDEAFGLRVHVEAMDARVRAVDFDRASLARVGASEIKGALFAAGLRTESDGDSLAVQILKAADPDDEILVVSRPGWHRIEGKDYPLFVTPGGASISEDDARLELATAARFGSVARGSLAGWKEAVAAAADAKGCPHFLLGVARRFCGRGAVAGWPRQLRDQSLGPLVQRQDDRAAARSVSMDFTLDRRRAAAIDALDRERRRGVRPGGVRHGAGARRTGPRRRPRRRATDLRDRRRPGQSTADRRRDPEATLRLVDLRGAVERVLAGGESPR